MYVPAPEMSPNWAACVAPCRLRSRYAVAASLSMAGVPPLLGFAAKEAAVEAVLKLSGFEQFMAAVGIFGGSVLTVAYTLRFVLLTFSGSPSIDVKPQKWTMSAPSVILAGLGVVLFFWIEASNRVVTPAAVQLNQASAELHCSVARAQDGVLHLGCHRGSGRSHRLADCQPGRRWHRIRSEQRPSIRLLDRTLSGAVEVTARIQHGSLPVYLATMSLVASMAGSVVVFDLDLDQLELWDSPCRECWR